MVMASGFNEPREASVCPLIVALASVNDTVPKLVSLELPLPFFDLYGPSMIHSTELLWAFLLVWVVLKVCTWVGSLMGILVSFNVKLPVPEVDTSALNLSPGTTGMSIF